MALLVLSAAGAGAARGDAKLGEDGLYHQDWFLESFLELKDDIAEAKAAGKRLAVIWEQRGCGYCKDMHLVNFAVPPLAAYVRDNFAIIQLNLYGAREVTDFDGKKLSEKELARRWGVHFTPTIMYFPDDPAAVAGKTGRDAEVARMPGYFKPPTFLAMFKYVRESDTAKEGFQEYLAREGERIGAEIDVPRRKR
ncbi:MAG: thioredoxin family protein [Alphaproteobacteria bacterium]|nr:thioredoxin family protein [Alphaproteobacteria bacterium]